jgi:large subunit ribosomal protein L7/L12
VSEAQKVDKLIDAIANLTVLEVTQLVEKIEEKFNVSATAAVAAAMPVAGQGSEGAVEEQTEFDVVMSSFGDKKINVIKVVREITGASLKEAKDLVEGTPSTIKSGASKAEAEEIVNKLKDAGASVDLK